MYVKFIYSWLKKKLQYILIFALLHGPEETKTHSSTCASVKLTSGPYTTSKNDLNEFILNRRLRPCNRPDVYGIPCVLQHHF